MLFTGTKRYLHQYETVRQKENLAVMSAVDALHKLYSSQSAPLVMLRSLGLTAVDSLHPLKVRLDYVSWGLRIIQPFLRIIV